ncbi:hypothetical protein Avbf_02086, partial [Armadillidium vulgare]
MGGMKRRRFDEDYMPRMKRMRGMPSSRGRGDKSANYPRERMRERSPGLYRSSQRRGGDQNSAYNGSGGGGGGGGGHKMVSSFSKFNQFHPPFDPIAPPRYYDGPPMPDYSSSSRSRSEKRPPSD